MHGRAIGRSANGKSATHAPGNASYNCSVCSSSMSRWLNSTSMIAQAMKSHQDAVIRLAEVPGLGVDSAQQIIAEVGATGRTFCSAAELHGLGGNLSRQRRKRRREPQQSLCERQ